MSDSEHGFFDHMGFDPELMRRARAFYVPMFEGRERVLDVACGRAEFLDVLGRGVGVDIEPEMVEAARAAGHSVEVADAFEFLRQRKEEYDGIFSAHFVEHLTSEKVIELIRLSFCALRTNGVLVICTPNAASLPTLQRQFWWDATHVRMYDVELLRYMLKGAGFRDVIGGVNPENTPGCPFDLEVLRVPDIHGMEQPRFQREVLDGLDRRTQLTHHSLKQVADTLRGLLELLYSPSEVFVRGVKS
jgi:SAM-dependent methyltransferase